MDVWTWGGGKREAGVNWEISIDTYTLPCVKQASLVVQMVKNLPVVWETWVQSLGREDALEEGPATHSSILAWRIPWTVEPGGLQSMGSQRHDWAKNLPAKEELWVQSLDWEDPLEKEMATHFNILACKNLMYGGSWQATSVPKSQAWLSD